MLSAHLIHRGLAIMTLLAIGQTAEALPPPAKAQSAPSPSELIQLRDRTFSGDPAKAELRNEVLSYLGIKPTEGVMYVFVSTSMPKALIQSYVAEALWTGAVLVVRGIPDGTTLNDWIRGYAVPLIGEKGVTAGLTIDPILFDLYGIRTVPTIIWDETDRIVAKDCDTTTVKKPGEKGQPFDVKTCKGYPEKSFFAVSGAVTLDYALEEFSNAGARQSEKRLGILRSYLGKGQQEQSEFSGDWAAYETAEMRAAIDRAKRNGDRYQSVMDSFIQPYFESDARKFGSGGFAPGIRSVPDPASDRK